MRPESFPRSLIRQKPHSDERQYPPPKTARTPPPPRKKNIHKMCKQFSARARSSGNLGRRVLRPTNRPRVMPNSGRGGFHYSTIPLMNKRAGDFSADLGEVQEVGTHFLEWIGQRNPDFLSIEIIVPSWESSRGSERKETHSPSSTHKPKPTLVQGPAFTVTKWGCSEPLCHGVQGEPQTR